MKKRGLFLALLMVAVLTLLGYARVSRDAIQVLRLSNRQVIELDRMVAEVSDAQLIFVGEYHDRRDSHRAQLEIIRKLHESGREVAIGLEMFTSANQNKLDRWVAGTMATKDFVALYRRDWNMPWPLYRDILVFARDHRIPLIGLNIPREVTRKVAREGFDALTPEERRLVPEEVTCSVDPDYLAFIKRAYREHSGGGHSFTHFCEAQMLWNKSMAHHLTRYLNRNPGQIVVVLAGSGHVLKQAIPEEVFKSSGYRYQVILPDMGWDDTTSEDTDYLIYFPPLIERLRG